MADRLIASWVIMIVIQQYVTGQLTDKWSRFGKDGQVLDIDSQYMPLLETVSNTSLKDCAGMTAGNPLLLWFVYNSERRECVTSQCWDIPTEQQPNSNNALYREQGASAPRSCSDVKTASPDSEDGEYLIYPDAPTFLGCPTKIYCFNMSSDNSSEFVTLPFTNVGVYPDRKNFNCSRETPLVGAGFGKDGTTIFNKIAIEPITMTVFLKRHKFATWNGTKNGYAEAKDCYNKATHPLCGPVGTFHINTEGTGMIVSMQQTWEAIGVEPFPPSVPRSTDGRQIDLLCGGYCGGCSPDGGLTLHRDPLADLAS